MKPLTLFLFLSLSLAGFGQIKIDSGDTLPTYRYSGNDTVGLSYQPIYDTVAVWIEYADTTKPISYNMTVKGYEVREITGYYWTSDEYSLMAIQEPRYKHVCYLNYYKQPITFLVWETKERREK